MRATCVPEVCGLVTSNSDGVSGAVATDSGALRLLEASDCMSRLTVELDDPGWYSDG